ncbi:hypothetical protein [Tamlana sp. I1]|uniref:hypothetical protein n=1 Tax=Tamlana sp. I1 TaxID=2762061 RepID=UPI00188F92E4|nr:hypothetical protein [Tamlana sp. I1]
MILNTTQDSIKEQDTVNTIMATKIVGSAGKIKSEDGAIIPKEAITWIALEPAMKKEEPKETSPSFYFLAAAVLIVLFVVVKFVLGKRNKSSK